MLNKIVKKVFITAVIVVATVTAVTFFVNLYSEKNELLLYNSETNEIYRTFPVSEGTEFSVEFIHSVNKSPVKDVFVIRNEEIVVDRTIYSAFGAGVQTEIEEGQKLEYDKDGNMVVSGFNIVFPVVKYIVGTVYDHVLCIQGECISLTELCGKNAHVAFKLK